MRVVGQSVERNDAREKVSGQTRYIDDVGFEGMLYGATFRSPAPHIRIKSLDLSRARRLPGVQAIATADDVPGRNAIPLVMQDHPVLASRKARFKGEAIALVAARTPEIARRAVELIEMDYEELPYVTDPLEARKRKAPRIFGKDNVFKSFRIRKGKGRDGFAEADVVVEGTYTTPHQAHAYLETQGMIACPVPEGGMNVYGSLQCPYYVHDAVAMCLGTTSNRVRVVQTATGGGFGGKEDVPSVVAAHAALLARVTDRPVKLIYTREEDFLSMSKRHPGWMKIRYGARVDGTLVACEVEYILDSGAYSTLSPVVLWRGTVHATGPYRIPHVHVDSHAVATNKMPCGAFRGFGQPQICFGQEALLDELAERLAMDPWDLRMKNILVRGDKTATGQKLTDRVGSKEVLRKVREGSSWDELRPPPGATASTGQRGVDRTGGDLARILGRKVRGIGASATFYGVCLGAMGRSLDRAAAHVQIQKDGSVIVAIGNTEVGQGARTVLAQIAAEALNAPYEHVLVMDTDTSRVPDSGPTVASRTTVMSGNAILDACKTLRRSIDDVARQMLKPRKGVRLEARDGRFHAGRKSLDYAEVVAECWAQRRKMSCQGWYVSPDTTFDEDGQGDAYVTYTFSANVVEIEVDTGTGEIRVLEAASAHDIGRAINPLQARGQIEGGIAQGLGYALTEEIVYDGADMLNGDFTGYILGTSADAPSYRPILVEHTYPEGPYGARGLGEPPLIGAAPAVANALWNACGVRARRLPLTPEYVRELLAEKEAKPEASLRSATAGRGLRPRPSTLRSRKRRSRSSLSRVHPVKVSCRINGRQVTSELPSGATLLDFLRRELLMTGTKEGCGMGECGACVVLVNGEPETSCLRMAAQVDGSEITTVEGLGRGDDLHPVQAAMVGKGGVQCGFCTPGILVSAAALLQENPSPTLQQIRKGLAGNLCRCTGYAQIFEAVREASRIMGGGDGAQE